MKEFYQKIFKNTVSIVLSVIACALLLGGFAWAATTISSNIETAGTLSVTGLSTLGAATSTSATSTAYIYVGADFSEDANMNFSGGDLFVKDAVNVGGVTYLDGALQATSTSLFTGAATFYSTIAVTGATTLSSTLNVTGLTTFGAATSTSATSTAYLYVGPDFSEDANMNFSGGDLFVKDAVNVGGVTYLDGALQATSTSLFTGAATFYSTIAVTGATTLSSTLDVTGLSTLAGGIDTAGATTDITLQNDETISNATDGNISFGTTAMSMATTTATTTGSVWVSAPAGTATSTIIVGGGEVGEVAVNPGCIELWRENAPYKIYINADGSGLTVAEGRCKD